MREKTGIITSTKMAKTLVVRVDEYKKHTKYNKLYRVSKKFFAHVEDENQYEEGQAITIVESRPMSARKRWKVADVQSELQS